MNPHGIILLFLVAILGSFTRMAEAQAVRDIARNTVVSAVVETEGAVHYYRFAAQAGETVAIETFAQRLTPASPLDTAVSLMTEDLGKVFAANDDSAFNSQTDSLVWFTLPATGNYIIKVEAFETFVGTRGVGGAAYRYQVRWNTIANTRTLDFAQIAEGDPFNTSIILVNPGTGAASGSVNLFADDGAAFMTILEGQLSSSFRFSVPARGTLRLDTSSTSMLRAGWARIVSDSSALAGTIVFIARGGGRIVAEAGVCPSDRSEAFTMFVDSVSPAVTGLGLGNTGTRSTSVSLTLRDRQGNTFGPQRAITLAPLEHRSEFIHELFTDVAGILNFQGTLSAASNAGPVAAVALRLDNPDLSALTTVPVQSQAGSTTTYFPQIANGANFRTSIVVINPSTVDASGQLRFFRSDGAGFPLPLTGGTSESSVGVRIPARGAVRLDSTGRGSLQAGWAVLTTDVAVTANAVFQTFSGPAVISEAGVSASRLIRRFTIFVDTIGTARTGLALANPVAAPVSMTMRLFNKNGAEVTTSPVRLTLLPNQHISRFIDQLLPNVPGIAEFEGSLLVEADGDISAVSFRFDNFDLSGFTTLCVIPDP